VLFYCRLAGHTDLSARLTESAYELTDRLAHYLCGRLPDHRANHHFIVPEMADNLDPPELAKAARRKLQAVSLFPLITLNFVLWE
jgi:G protein-coupled receptor kinase interactor 1